MVMMTERTENLLRRLVWLCDELRAGNRFSDETLLRWSAAARENLRYGEDSRECMSVVGALSGFSMKGERS